MAYLVLSLRNNDRSSANFSSLLFMWFFSAFYRFSYRFRNHLPLFIWVLQLISEGVYMKRAENFILTNA